MSLGAQDLAHKMWTDKINGQDISISGNQWNEPVELDYNQLSLAHARWKDDERYKTSEIIKLHKKLLDQQPITAEFEDDYITDFPSKREILVILTDYKEILIVDKRAVYIMALEVARVTDGQISEDDKASWLTPDEFEKNHQDILSLTYEDANDLSLEEIKNIEVIDEPYWEEEEKRKEEHQRWMDENTFGF
ncbi:MAG: hypothetical protein FWE43_02980 [Streptococcaceae bacterium]|nr:hypothetical protein [Streptococcaceae bacterium]MCL2681427.1 hypothetical protein [Streptococcaceae bacterium]